MTDHAAATDPDQSPAHPVVRVVAGSPSAEEVAALVAVLSAVAGGDHPGDSPRRASNWSAPGGRMRHTHAHGYGAWRGSALPR
jgi:hypothetical protein